MHKESKLASVVWIGEARNASAEFEAQPAPGRPRRALWQDGAGCPCSGSGQLCSGRDRAGRSVPGAGWRARSCWHSTCACTAFKRVPGRSSLRLLSSSCKLCRLLVPTAPGALSLLVHCHTWANPSVLMDVELYSVHILHWARTGAQRVLSEQ